jgi:CRISPR-associated endonuclease/helicase Cas3
LNILIISQCSKRALTETRRVLDQFAERKGERSWQTAITQQGLLTLRKMLRKTARRNTAICCHWIKTGNRTEVLWFIGNRSRFNEQGTVPTNTTRRNILRSSDENQWHTAEDIALLAGIAGLFHDFGKANLLFQNKLQPGYHGKPAEPYRHEWISLRMFQAFVGSLDDQQWLNRLQHASDRDEPALLEAIMKDGLDVTSNPFKPLPPLAKTIAWLILSHHRLPKYSEKTNAPQLSACADWLTEDLDPLWNGSTALHGDWSAAEKRNVWRFAQGTPLLSEHWRDKAHSFAGRALRRPSLLSNDWMADAFTLHLSRMVLMLADHHYSAHEVTPKWQDSDYPVHANTDRNSGQLKQQLDEHLIGVGINAVMVARYLPDLRRTLPAITRHKGFKKRGTNEKFRWQDKAYELASSIEQRSTLQGFFGVNMASTGCGKTLANGRIMYGLADETIGCRFSIALGLRTLTLQTGDALRERLHLDDDDLAVMVGSQAVKDLHEFDSNFEKVRGSESAEELVDEHQYVHYEGALDDGRISRWLRRTPRLHQMVSAPVLVSTIDQLMPATEGERGGKQIAPMLRLLSADLVLDEPDDFDLADLPALARLVNWAAMLGSRVLLSSATLPPALIQALFDAYLHGREAYQRCIGAPGSPLQICCAWFDENDVAQSDHADLSTFTAAHQRFVQTRASKLAKAPPLRLGQLLPVNLEAKTTSAVVSGLATCIHTELQQLHQQHGQDHPHTRQRVSVGLVRMANINPLVAVAKQLLATQSQPNHRIHYCVYHSQHPLAVRSAIEKQLDAVLTRHQPEALWTQASIQHALTTYPEDNHIFVVLATAVAEVGRDHDYDWAIVEPSSMRSLIQLAGRIQRHRRQQPGSPNIRILNGNYRALKGDLIAYSRPGFESNTFKLRYKNMERLLTPDQYGTISALPRIIEPLSLQPSRNLADLEHVHLKARLFGSKRPDVPLYAALWWQQHLHWSYELQRRTPFRSSAPDENFILSMEDDDDSPVFKKEFPNGEFKRDYEIDVLAPMPPVSGVSTWGHQPFAGLAIQLADSLGMELSYCCQRFGCLRLRTQSGSSRWSYDPLLGVHSALE